MVLYAAALQASSVGCWVVQQQHLKMLPLAAPMAGCCLVEAKVGRVTATNGGSLQECVELTGVV